MFRKPKKQITRRVFSGNSDDEVEVEKMSVDAMPELSSSKKKVNKESKSVAKESKKLTSALLSFGDEEGTLDLLRTFSCKTRAFYGILIPRLVFFFYMLIIDFVSAIEEEYV